jgi:hypothetical protein
MNARADPLLLPDPARGGVVAGSVADALARAAAMAEQDLISPHRGSSAATQVSKDSVPS